MAFSFSDLMRAVTTDEQEEVFLAALEGVGLQARTWREGGALRTILRIVAAVYAAFTDLMVRFAKAGFLELSSGGWLTLLAANLYSVTRVEATFATGEVTLTNTGGGIYTVAAGELTLVNSVTGKTYRNTAGFTLAALSTLTIAVQAVELGSASNASPGAVTQFETPPPGGTLTVTNAAAIVGRDEESDPDLRSRCRAKLAALSNRGPRLAYEYAARTAPRIDGSIVDINRVNVVANPDTGVVSIYVATPTGAPVVGDVAYVQASVDENARPDSVTATVYAANPVALSRTLTVWAKQTPGLASADLAALVNAELIALSSTYPIGGIRKTGTQGYLYASRIDGAVIAAHPTIFDVDGSGSDVALAVQDVISLSTTLDVRLVP